MMLRLNAQLLVNFAKRDNTALLFCDQAIQEYFEDQKQFKQSLLCRF